jgi:hypothetical protein
MARYKYQDPSNGLFLNINLKDQLLVGTFEWTLDYLIDRTDLSLFDQKADKTNIVIKALASDAEPDHDTIAHFISSNSDAVQDLFSQILYRCSELELLNGEMFAIDGCNMSSNVSMECQAL